MQKMMILMQKSIFHPSRFICQVGEMAILQQLSLFARRRLQSFNLLQVSSAVAAHSLNKVRNGHLSLHFRMKS